MDLKVVIESLEYQKKSSECNCENSTLSNQQQDYEEGYLNAMKYCLKLLKDNLEVGCESVKTCLFCQYAEAEEYPFDKIGCSIWWSFDGLDKRDENDTCDKFEHDYRYRRICTL